jgi:putative Flp pilus-assembly TadE/G-like protein
MSRVKSLLRSGDRGGVAAIVAVLLAGGVLLGMAAFVVDIGTLYTEREELLSGADSAAQALAIDCSRGGLCGNADLTRAVTAANSNAKDGLSNVDLICGSVSGVVGLMSCPAPKSGDYTACLGTAPTNGVNWIEVHTSTEVSGGGTVLPPVFAQAVVPGYSGATVHACARVAWGPQTGGLAVTFSQCEWNKYTSGGTLYAPEPPYPPYPATSFEHVILLHDPSAKDNGCGAGPAGFDAPGGFGWTDDPNNDCLTAITNGTYGGNTGNNFPQECQQVFLDAWTNRTVLTIPIYTTVKGQGNNKTTYTGGDSAGFVLTGYSLGSVTKDSWLPGSKASCAKNQSCIYGFFVGPLQQSTGSLPGTGNNYGVTIFKTIG